MLKKTPKMFNPHTVMIRYIIMKPISYLVSTDMNSVKMISM